MHFGVPNPNLKFAVLSQVGFTDKNTKNFHNFFRSPVSTIIFCGFSFVSCAVFYSLFKCRISELTMSILMDRRFVTCHSINCLRNKNDKKLRTFKLETGCHNSFDKKCPLYRVTSLQSVLKLSKPIVSRIVLDIGSSRDKNCWQCFFDYFRIHFKEI